MPEQRALRTPDDVKVALEAALPTLRRIALRLCRNRTDGEDLVQSLCVRVLQKKIPITIGDLNAWLAKSLTNMFIDRCRSQASRPSHEPLEDNHTNISRFEPDAPEPYWGAITAADIRDAAEEIKPPYREVYMLHSFEHLSYEEIAQKLGGIGTVTVGTRLNRARKKLREILVARFDVAPGGGNGER